MLGNVRNFDRAQWSQALPKPWWFQHGLASSLQATTMSSVHALDRYYLAFTLLVTVGYQLLGFAIAWTLQFDKITDFTGGVFDSLLCARSLKIRKIGSNFFMLGRTLSYFSTTSITTSPTALLTLLCGNTYHARNISMYSIMVLACGLICLSKTSCNCLCYDMGSPDCG